MDDGTATLRATPQAFERSFDANHSRFHSDEIGWGAHASPEGRGRRAADASIPSQLTLSIPIQHDVDVKGRLERRFAASVFVAESVILRQLHRGRVRFRKT